MDPPSASASPPDPAPAGRRHVLIVEDNEADIYLIEEALRITGLALSVQVVKNGEQAIRYFDRADRDHALPCPDLVLLDINLPRKSGTQTLRHMRRSRRCSGALVIAVSTSGAARDREAMDKLGANGYFHKPSDLDQFMKLGDMVKALLDAAPPPAGAGN